MVASETIGFWTGLFASIVGIVLSIVAIVFSILVDRRSGRISDHTIQSLQKIESAVERSSSDTRELIKAGWDKMLGNVNQAQALIGSESSAKEVAAGIAAELRSELNALSSTKGASSEEPQLKVDGLEKYLKNLEASLAAQLKAAQGDARPSVKTDGIIETIRGLTTPTQALLRSISRHHLTRRQYKQLSAGQCGPSLLELRQEGLLVPVVHETNQGSVPCYYFPPGTSRAVHIALQMIPESPSFLNEEVRKELKAIGYLSEDGDDYQHDHS